MIQAVFVVYSKLDENYGAPFKVFRNRESFDQWAKTNKDQWGLEYCCEKIEVEG